MNALKQTLHFENLVRQEWNNNTTVSAWEQWAKEQAVHCQPLTEALIEHAKLEANLQVLDLACGVGQPSLTIAQKIGPDGSVVATDLSEGMLDVADKQAREAGLQNIDFQVADAHQLPFEDNTFDRVVSRLGLMYFWDINSAISEVFRVLKPGGIASFVVWGPAEKSEFFGTILKPFMDRKEMPTAPKDAPTPTRFGEVNELINAFKNQGFSKVESHEYCEVLPFPGAPKAMFKHFYDMAAPIQPYIDSFSEEQQRNAIKEIEQGFAHCWDGNFTHARGSFNAIYMVK
jgi:ubiquinone/menaquinone biosynthesis C-methylase UbiE